MKKLATIAVLAAGALVLPAQAKPPHPSHPAHPTHPAHPESGGKSSSCAVRTVGFRAGGKLVSQTLTQTQGAATATKKDDRYSGNVVVDGTVGGTDVAREVVVVAAGAVVVVVREVVVVTAGAVVLVVLVQPSP